MTKKQIVETYKGKRFDPNDRFSTITAIAFHKGVAVLLSGKYDTYGGGYTVEAAIDMATGENVIAGHWRPADSKEDAIDVYLEILDACKK